MYTLVQPTYCLLFVRPWKTLQCNFSQKQKAPCISVMVEREMGGPSDPPVEAYKATSQIWGQWGSRAVADVGAWSRLGSSLPTRYLSAHLPMASSSSLLASPETKMPSCLILGIPPIISIRSFPLTQASSVETIRQQRFLARRKHAVYTKYFSDNNLFCCWSKYLIESRLFYAN